MTAGVAEYPRPPIAAANREQRRTEADAFDVVPRVRDGRRWDEHAGKRAQQSQFIRESFRVEVVFHWLAPCLTFIGRARVDVSEYPAHNLQIVGD
jgi:hypothetical protein